MHLKNLTSFLLVIAGLLACAPAGLLAAERNYVISTLNVRPIATGNGTNVALFSDKAGTNWVSISPTNAQFKIRYLGSNYTAFSTTNLYLTNAAASAGRILVFRNGLLVDVIAQ